MLVCGEWEFEDTLPTTLNADASIIADIMCNVLSRTTLCDELLNFFSSEHRIEVLYRIAQEWDLTEYVKEELKYYKELKK